MKVWILLLLILLVLGLYFLLNGKKPAPAVKTESRWETITPAEVHARLEQGTGVNLVDVRTPAEYRTGHLPQSISLPLNTLASAAPARFKEKNEGIVVYCRSGARSELAAKILSELGYTRVYDMGGIVNWPYSLEK
jgi:phage shock protein E